MYVWLERAALDSHDLLSLSESSQTQFRGHHREGAQANDVDLGSAKDCSSTGGEVGQGHTVKGIEVHFVTGWNF